MPAGVFPNFKSIDLDVVDGNFHVSQAEWFVDELCFTLKHSKTSPTPARARCSGVQV